MNNIELHIEKLILHGFPPGDHHRISHAVELELTRLFTEQGVSDSMSNVGEISNLDGGQFDVASNSNESTIGSQVAQSVYSGLNKSHQTTGKT